MKAQKQKKGRIPIGVVKKHHHVNHLLYHFGNPWVGALAKKKMVHENKTKTSQAQIDEDSNKLFVKLSYTGIGIQVR